MSTRGFTRGGRRGSLRQRGRKALPGPESVARWSREGRAACKTEKNSAVRFLLLDRRKVFQSRGNTYTRGDGDVFFLWIFRFHFHCLCGVVPGCAFSSVNTKNSKKMYTTWGYARTYGMRRSGCFPGSSMELLASASRLFAPSNCSGRLFRSFHSSS